MRGAESSAVIDSRYSGSFGSCRQPLQGATAIGFWPLGFAGGFLLLGGLFRRFFGEARFFGRIFFSWRGRGLAGLLRGGRLGGRLGGADWGKWHGCPPLHGHARAGLESVIDLVAIRIAPVRGDY